MAFPWIPIAMMAGSYLLNNKLNNKLNPKYQFTKPEKEEVVLTDKDINREMMGLLSDLGMMQTQQIANIKQAGAAKRLPEGAILSAIAGTSERTARGAAKALPQLKRLQKQSYADYYRLLNMAEQGEAQLQMMQNQAQQSALGGLFGGLGSVLSLWQMGAFEKPDWSKLIK